MSEPCRPLILPTLLAMAGAVSSRPALCQTAPGGEGSYQLQTVVVTAEKRTENAQDVPISLSALTGAELQAQGISDVAAATRQTPGVAQTSSGPGQTEYTIRGLSSPGAAVSTVGFYLDDVPMTAPSGAQNGHVTIDPDLYDLNRIEVLRGPQGTLYGAGSMGGTIKLITNQPDLRRFAGSSKLEVSGTQGGGFNWGADGMLNLPLIDGKLALRLVATDERNSGWIDRVTLANFPLPTNPQPQCEPFYGCDRGSFADSPVERKHSGVNGEEMKSGRAALRYQPSDALSIVGTIFYQSIDQSGVGYIDVPPAAEAHYQPFDVAEPFSDIFRLYNVVASWHSDALSATSITSYWTRSQAQTQDISETIQTLFDFPGYSTADGGAGPVSLTEVDGTRQFSEELRLASRGDSRLKWLVGGFFSRYTYTQDQFSLAQGFVAPFGTDNLVTTLVANYLKQKAVFGQLSFDLSRSFKATVGLRRYSYTQNGPTTTSGIVTSSLLVPATTMVAASDSGVSPKVTLSYQHRDNLLLYTTAAKGFRPGAGNLPVPITGADSCLANLEALGKTSAPTQYKPDTVWSYELGEKATLWDQRASLNSDVYYEQWNGVQQQVQLGCGFPYIDNVGIAHIRGVEAELKIRLARFWTLLQSAGYTHAILTQTELGTGLTAGQQLLNVPKYSASTSLEFNHPLGALILSARADNVLQGAQLVQSYFLHTLPGYDLANVRLGVEGDSWSAYFFVDNVADRQAELADTHNYALNIPSLRRLAVVQPRTAGITFSYKF